MSGIRPRPLVLTVLDGIGLAAPAEGNAVSAARMPVFSDLSKRGLSAALSASGVSVGLPEGARGSGQAGLLTLGAGRIVPSVQSAIDETIRANKHGHNVELDRLMQLARYDGCPLHLIGLVSDAGIHSSFEHLLALVDLAALHEIPMVLHAVLDGVDSAPKNAASLLDRLQLQLEGKNAVIGTVAGRDYAMAREGRWDRVHRAFQAIVRDNVLGPSAPRAETVFDALSLAYRDGITDAYVEPTRIGDYQGLRGDFLCDFTGTPPVWEWTGEDCGLVFHHRGDGLRQLTQLLTREGLPEDVRNDLLMDRHHPVRAFREHCLVALAHTSRDLTIPVAFPRAAVHATLGEVIARAGRTQHRVFESDGEDHATTFFDGGRSLPLEGESREVIPSPRLIERYDEKPALNVAKVAARAVAAIEAGEHDFIFVHLGNAERVAGTGNREATLTALEALDAALGAIATATAQVDGALVVTADHGGCEELLDSRGRAKGPHSANPVPFLLVCAAQEGVTLRAGGGLRDVAPTLLELLELERPEEMTGRSLLSRS